MVPTNPGLPSDSPPEDDVPERRIALHEVRDSEYLATRPPRLYYCTRAVGRPTVATKNYSPVGASFDWRRVAWDTPCWLLTERSAMVVPGGRYDD